MASEEETVVEETVVEDKDVDGAFLRIVHEAENNPSSVAETPSAGRSLVFESVLTRQQPHFAHLVDDMPSQSILRRLLKLLFPLVDESQRVRS
jgi:hypothetical protein